MSAISIFLGLTTVLPAEYGMDPTGIGGLLGLTKMGEMKTGSAMPWKTGFATDPTNQKKMAWIAQRENRGPGQAFAIAFKCIEAKEPDLEMTIFTPVPYSILENYGTTVPLGLSADRGEIVTLSVVPRNEQGILILAQAQDQRPAILRALESIGTARRYIAVAFMGIEISFPASDGRQAVTQMLAHCTTK